MKASSDLRDISLLSSSRQSTAIWTKFWAKSESWAGCKLFVADTILLLLERHVDKYTNWALEYLRLSNLYGVFVLQGVWLKY